MSQISEIKFAPTIPEINLNLQSQNSQSDLDKFHEEYMQDMAGIEPNVDYAGARSFAASQLQEEEENNLFNATQLNLKNGEITPDQAANLMDYYSPQSLATNEDIALEKLAVRNSISDAITFNESTKWNTISSGIDPDEEEIEKTRDLVIDNYKDKFYDGGNGKGLGGTMEFLVTSMLPGIGAEYFEGTFAGITGIKDLMTSVSDEETQQKLAEWGRKNVMEVSPEEAKKNLEKVWKFCEKVGVPAQNRRRFFDSAILNEKENNLFSTVNIAAAGLATKGTLSKAYKWLKTFGNKEAAVEVAVDAVKRGDKTATAVLEHNGPTLVKPEIDNTVSLYSRAVPVEDVYKDVEINSIINEQRAAGLFENVSQDDMVKNAAKQLEKENNDIASHGFVDLHVVDGEAGEKFAQALIGGGLDGKKAIANEAECEQIAKRLRLTPGSYDVVQGEGGFFIRYETPVTFNGSYYEHAEDVVEGFNYPGREIFHVFWGHVKQTAEAFGRTVEANRKNSGMIKRLFNRFKTDLKLDKKSSQRVGQVISEGQQANDRMGKWFTKEELLDKGLNEKEIDAYFNYKKLNDIEYRVNDEAFVRRATENGFSFYQDQYIAKEVPYNNKTSTKLKHITVPGGIKDTEIPKLLEDLKTGRKVLLEKYAAGYIGNNKNITHVIVDAQDLKRTRIPYGLTPYQEGGIRRYQTGTFFIKQGVTLDGIGGKFNGWANTLTTTTNRAVAKEYVEEMNALIDAWNRGGATNDAIMQDAINHLKTRRSRINDVEDFKKILYNDKDQTGWLRTDNHLQILEDGQKYTYTNNVTDSIEQHAASTEDAFRDLIADAANGRYSRGQMLGSIDDEMPPLLDFKQIADEAINRAARTNTILETKKWWQTTFAENFKNLIDYDATGPLSDLELLEKGVVDVNRGSEFKKQIRAAQNMQERWKMLSGAKTATDNYIEGVIKSFADILADSKIAEVVPFLRRGGNLYNFLATSRPDKFITKVEFASAMGFMNTKQFLKQALGITATFGIHPLRTTQAVMAYPFLRAAYHFKDKPGIMKTVTDAMASAGMMSKKNAEGFIKFMERTDTLGATGRLPMISEQHWKAIQNSRIAKGMYYFADMGNNMVYGVADIVAYLEGAKRGWNDMKILAHADDLALNMTRSGNSWGQREVPILMQWTSYPLRLLEAFGNKRLNKFQRASLGLSQLAMWGYGGAVGEEYGVNAYQWLTAKHDVDPEIAKVVCNGIVTSIANEFGYEISEGLEGAELVERIFDLQDKVGKGNLYLNVPALRIKSRIASAWNLVRSLYHTATEDDANLMMAAVKAAQDKDLPTGIRNLANMYTGLTSNKVFFYDTEFKTKYKDATGKDLAAYMIGLDPYEVKEERLLKLIEKKFKGDIQEAVKSTHIDAILDPYFEEYVGNMHLFDNLVAIHSAETTHEESLLRSEKAVRDLRMFEEMVKRSLKSEWSELDDVVLDQAVFDYLHRKAFKARSLSEAVEEQKGKMSDQVVKQFSDFVDNKGEK